MPTIADTKLCTGRSQIMVPVLLSAAINAVLLGVVAVLLVGYAKPAPRNFSVELADALPTREVSLPVRAKKFIVPLKQGSIAFQVPTPLRSVHHQPVAVLPIARFISRPQLPEEVPAQQKVSDGAGITIGQPDNGTSVEAIGGGIGIVSDSEPGVTVASEGAGESTGPALSQVASRTIEPEHVASAMSSPHPSRDLQPKPIGEMRGVRVTQQFQPPYPADAREDGVEGIVYLMVTVDAAGRVEFATVDRGSGDKRLDRAAQAAVRKWSFLPSVKDGEAVTAAVRVKVDFQLR